MNTSTTSDATTGGGHQAAPASRPGGRLAPLFGPDIAWVAEWVRDRDAELCARCGRWFDTTSFAPAGLVCGRCEPDAAEWWAVYAAKAEADAEWFEPADWDSRYEEAAFAEWVERERALGDAIGWRSFGPGAKPTALVVAWVAEATGGAR